MVTSQKKTKTSSKRKSAPVAQEATAATVSAQRVRREALGVVVSDKMQKTIVVKVDRRVRHDLYRKYVTRSRRFKAHDEKNEAKVGDVVQIVETRPLSRDKRWALKKVVRQAAQTAEANV
jgi:small subunit ribosomal protein S17